MTKLMRKALADFFEGTRSLFSESDYYYRTLNREYSDAAKLVRDYYEIISHAVSNIDEKNMDKEDLIRAQKYFKNSFRISENETFWTTERKVFERKYGRKLDENLIDETPIEKRQMILLDNLDKWTMDFNEFRDIRSKTIEQVNSRTIKGEKLITENFYTYLTKGIYPVLK